MSDTTLADTPLLDISIYDGGHRLLAGEISRRFQNGGQQEIADFIAQCSFKVLWMAGLSVPRGNIWHTDNGVWRSFARLTAQRALLWVGADAFALRDAAWSQELQRLGRDCLARAGSDPIALEQAREYMFTGVTPRLGYPDIARSEVLALVEEHLVLRSEAGLSDDKHHDSPIAPLLACLADPADLVALGGSSSFLFRQSIRAHIERTGKTPMRGRWLAWQGLFAQRPDHVMRHLDEIADPGLSVRHWAAAHPATKGFVARGMLNAMPVRVGDDQDHVADAINELIEQDQAGFLDMVWSDSDRLGLALALVARPRHDRVLQTLFPAIHALRQSANSGGEPLNLVLAAQPALLLGIDGDRVADAIAVISAELLPTVLPVLGECITSSPTVQFRRAAIEAVKQLALADISDAGWFASDDPILHQACQNLLLTHPDRASAAALLASLRPESAHDRH